MPKKQLFWCNGCGRTIGEHEVQNLSHVGKRCLLCGSGRVTPEKESETLSSTPKESTSQ